MSLIEGIHTGAQTGLLFAIWFTLLSILRKMR